MSTANVKHAPATALPWEYDAQPGDLSGWIGQPDTEGREGVTVASPEPHAKQATSARKNATCVRVLDERSAQDAAYITHAANAYPKLIAALKGQYDGTFEQLLRDLGEAG